MKLYLSLAELTGLIDKLKDNLGEFRRSVSEAQKVTYVDSSELSGLVDLARTLDAMNQPDSIEREMVLRHKIDGLRQNYIRNAYRQFSDAMVLPELTEVRQGFAMCFYYMAQYQRAIESLTKPDLVSLLAAFPHAQFAIMDAKPHPTSGVTFDEASCIVKIIGPNGDLTSVIKIDGLSEIDSSHLVKELNQPEFISKMMASPLTPAYAILSVPISPSPTTQMWRSTITALMPWLIRTAAYLNIAPVPNQSEKDLGKDDKLNKSPILDSVELDTDHIIKSVLDRYDHRRRRITVEMLDQ